jgi:peptidoglycan/LPS O-acetylase OafA/YrhL
VSDVRLPRRRGLDGLRALAVAAVLLYHLDLAWIPGGFLGVDVFFAISGYLITSLLLVELVAHDRISLRSFWARRARRLLPAVGALLVGVTVASLVGAHDAVGRLRGDVLAATAYVSNWWQIIRGETYFDTFGRPPLLRHLWSLAVEEQLYVVLPIVVALFGRRRRALAAGALAGAVGSLLLLNGLWSDVDPSRAWYGTDTRAAPVLVGVALALVVPMTQRRRWTGVARSAIDALGLSSLVGLAWLMLTIGERETFLHTWGFALTAVLAGTAVVAITSPSSRVGWILGMRPLVWLGTRSYAVYLWHWPVFALTRPGLDVSLDGWGLLVLRLLIVGVLAELSWRYVEQPVRTGAFAAGWRALRRGVRVRVALGAASAVAVLTAALAVGLSTAATSDVPDLLATVSRSPMTATTLAQIPPTTATTTTTTTTTVAPHAAPAAAPPPPTTAVPAPPPPPPGAVLAIGDSVMLAARDALLEASGGRMYVDAAVGRQVSEGLDVLQRYKDNGTFANLSAIVVHLGTNGPMTDDLFNRLAAIVEGVPRVVVLNVRVPKSWEQQSDAAIDGGVPQRANMRLGDWFTESHQDGALGDDGVHPTRKGARIYSYVVLQGLQDAPPPTTTTTTAPPTTTSTAPTTTSTTAPVAPTTTLVTG